MAGSPGLRARKASMSRIMQFGTHRTLSVWPSLHVRKATLARQADGNAREWAVELEGLKGWCTGPGVGVQGLLTPANDLLSEDLWLKAPQRPALP